METLMAIAIVGTGSFLMLQGQNKRNPGDLNIKLILGGILIIVLGLKTMEAIAMTELAQNLDYVLHRQELELGSFHKKY